jgi:hypothetical protein
LVYHAEGKRHRLLVFENRALRGIFEPKKEDVTQNDRHNERFNNFYSSLNIKRMISLRKMR